MSNLGLVTSFLRPFSRCLQTNCKVEAPITDRGPITDFIFKGLTFPRHVSMKAINNCLKLKLSRIGSSILSFLGAITLLVLVHCCM
jgi:hypothetical protein